MLLLEWQHTHTHTRQVITPGTCTPRVNYRKPICYRSLKLTNVWTISGTINLQYPMYTHIHTLCILHTYS